MSKPVVILGVFVADTAYRADRAPRMGETIMGNSFALGPGGSTSCVANGAARLLHCRRLDCCRAGFGRAKVGTGVGAAACAAFRVAADFAADLATRYYSSALAA